MAPLLRTVLTAVVAGSVLACAGCGGGGHDGTAGTPAVATVPHPSVPTVPHPPVAAAVHASSFQTPAHDIACLVGGATHEVSCAVSDRRWHVPGGDRRWCGATALQGLTLRRGHAPEFLCGTDVLVPDPAVVLAFGRRLESDGFTCWSRRSGVTCDDGGAGHFLVGRDTYRTD